MITGVVKFFDDQKGVPTGVYRIFTNGNFTKRIKISRGNKNDRSIKENFTRKPDTGKIY